MAEDFDKTVKLPSGNVSQGDADKTVRLTPSQNMPEPPMAEIDSISPSQSASSSPLKMAAVLILLLAALGAAWYFVPGALMKKAADLSKAGDHAGAAKQLKIAVYFFPLKQETYLSALGKVQRLSSDLNGAQASLEKALKKAPNDYQAAKELGLTAKAQGQNERAFQLLNHCAQTNPEDREVVSLAAQTAFDLKDYKSAAELYGNYLKSGGSADEFEKLGIALYQTGNEAEAVKALERAFQSNKALKGVPGLLAKIYSKQGNHEAALFMSSAELDNSPGDLDMIHIMTASSMNLAAGFAKQKKYADASSALERGLKAPSNESANIHYELARLAALQGKKAGVFNHLKEAFAINGALKRGARRDRSFQAYRNTPQFRKLLK